MLREQTEHQEGLFTWWKKHEDFSDCHVSNVEVKKFNKLFELLVKIIKKIQFFSNLSGISLLGIPSEIYLYGTQYSLCTLGAALMMIVVGYVYLPVFYKLQLDSTYDYLRLRYDNRIKIMSSILFIVFSLLFIPIVIYVPALAFNQGKSIFYF